MMKNIGFSVKTSRSGRVRRALANGFLGLLIIAVGVGYLGNYIDLLPWTGFTLFFSGWGSLFLIVPALYFLIRRPWSWFWLVSLLVGVLILLSNISQYSFSHIAAILLAVLVIIIGLRVMFSPLIRRARKRAAAKRAGAAFSEVTGAGDGKDAHYAVHFSGRNIDMSGETFSSATLETSFGEMNFDLRGAVVQNCAVIDVRCSFGETRIFLPPEVRVELNPVSSFGEVTDSHVNPADPNAPVVYINADCSFGEISIL